MTKEQLLTRFKEKFSKDPERFFFAPGRINLIGEHTDYNGGHVFPCSITLGTYALSRKRTDRVFRLYSVNFPEKGVIEIDLDHLEYNEKHSWANYPKGMIQYLIEYGGTINTGVDVLFYGNIPNGAGLSSSASIELVTGVMLAELFYINIDMVQMVKIGQQVENQFLGVNSGIMDQFAIGMGKKEHGIFLDCETLQFEYAPLLLKNHEIIIMNTNKRRELTESNYNERRNECEEALKQLQKVTPIESLGNLTPGQFEQLKGHIINETTRKRAKHAVYENERTKKALQVLKRNDLIQFGQLMNESHFSLRDDYEVTGKELDTIVDIALQQDGVLGARMTGAGFGGCAIAIVQVEKIPSFIEQVGKSYREKIGYKADFYIVQISDGPKEISLEEIQ